jgi:hypothetical protein
VARFNAMGDEGIGGYLGDANEQMPIVTSPTSPVAPRDAEGELERSSDALPGIDGWCWLVGFSRLSVDD